MFATIILDSYEYEERSEMAEAIDENCSPNDTWGWSSNGIYCFWNVDTKEILYIGLASDLSNRFKQHNGLNGFTQEGTKQNEITNYFKENKKLGYSIFVQSPLNQISVSRSKENKECFDEEFLDDRNDELKKLEGRLIQAFKLKTGNFPKWNKINGKGVKPTSYELELIDFFTNSKESIIISRKTLRELSSDPTFCYFESTLHGIKMFHMCLEKFKKLSKNIEKAIFLMLDKSIIISKFSKSYEELINEYYDNNNFSKFYESRKDEIIEYSKMKINL